MLPSITVKNALCQFLRHPKTLFQIGTISVCLALLYYSTLKSLVGEWIELPDFSHGFLIPFISLYFVWDRRDQLAQLRVSPGNAGLPVILFGLVLLLFGNLAAEAFTTRISLLIVIAGLIVFQLGWYFFKKLGFPVAFLLLMIPLPSILMQKVTFPMQLFASKVAECSLQTVGIPVLREGNVIQLADASLEVAQACSGIRSLISLLALGTVFAYFRKESSWQRAILVISSLPIAILINAVRVSATGVLASYYGVSMAKGFFHGFSGYVLFVVAFAILLIVNFLLSKIWPTNPSSGTKR
jgi:exosortase